MRGREGLVADHVGEDVVFKSSSFQSSHFSRANATDIIDEGEYTSRSLPAAI